VLVVDDDEGERAVLAAALRSGGIDVLEARDAAEAVDIVEQERCALALVEINLPGVCGYELCRRLRADPARAIPVIFVSGERTEPYDRVAGLLLGADDYVTKPFEPDELVARVRAVLRRAPPRAQRPRALTNRELEVLTLLAEGYGQRQIAAALFISPKTVGTHIEHILEKLGVRSRAHAVAVAFREDLVGVRG
jgi:two-component system OmpR family response regulator